MQLLRNIGFLGLIAFAAGCSSAPKNATSPMRGESLVFMGQESTGLRFKPKFAPTLRSTYLPNLTNTIQYELGRDFILDSKAGTLRRTVRSRIPDFSTNMLFGKEDFDHSSFPGFGNNPFFAYADYKHGGKISWPVQSAQIDLLPRTTRILETKQPLKIVAYGDSITAGGDATQPSLIYWQRWADALQKRYPDSSIKIVNGATGGDSTVQGIARLKEKVLDQKPDLVLIGFGMNDHNVGGYGVPLDQFKQNLRTIIDQIRAQSSAEVILLSTFPPNGKWRFGSHRMQEYAAATQQVAIDSNCAFADIYQNWLTMAEGKKTEDLLANNINHPNDFGHWIYFQVLENLGF